MANEFGTINNAAKIAVANLADGTDGQLITWDAAGVAAVVPTGTATHVLTSNGAGAAPTFQAASGGGGGLAADGWTAITATGTSGTLDSPSFEISFDADMTALIGLGDRIKITQATTKYFIVTKVGAFSGGNTIITCYGGTDYTLVATATTAITNPYYSHVKNPFGFPMSPAKWTVTLTDSTDQSATPAAGNPTTNVVNMGTLSISIPIGEWNVTFYVQMWANGTGVTSAGLHAGLSTANNTLPASALRGFAAIQGASGVLSAGASMCVSRLYTLTSKTTYYCTAYTPWSGMTIYFYNLTIAPMTVTCVCAYL